MQIINSENQLTIDLYHGTSTLFLDNIIEKGLGGLNPVKEWKLVELSQEIYQLSEKYLADNKLFQTRSYSFKKMTEQSNKGSFNFQHGDTYLSPSQQTATKYAIGKRYGSELLTYVIDLLQELLKLDIQYMKSDLYRKYSKVFGLIEANLSPLLIEVKNVNITSLLTEHGADPTSNLQQIDAWVKEGITYFDAISQQTNFRLIAPVNTNNLKFWFINVKKWNAFSPEYNLYEINTENTVEKIRTELLETK
jgi:hypothetical protein